MGDNVAVVAAIFEHFAEGDFWAMGAYLAADVEWSWAAGYSGLNADGVLHGTDEVARSTREWLATWDWFTMTPEEIVEVGDRVLAIYRSRARLKGSDNELVHLRGSVITLRDGLVVRYEDYETADEARAAAGA